MQLNIPSVKQHMMNDCWICCTMMIYNYYFPMNQLDYTSHPVSFPLQFKHTRNQFTNSGMCLRLRQIVWLISDSSMCRRIKDAFQPSKRYRRS